MVEELIEEGQYSQALSLLTDLNDEKTRYLRLVCLNGLEEFVQAKKEGMIAKIQASDTYYDVIAMYITTLRELGEFEEAIEILIEELSMPYIPYQYESLFNAVYDQILLDKQEANYELESNNQIFSIEEIEQLLKNKQKNDDLLYMCLEQLQQLNIRLILPTVHMYLEDPTRHFFAKTLLMEILIEQQVDEEFEVEKWGIIYDFNPSYMPLVLAQTHYQAIGQYLEHGLEDENPALLEQCLDFLEFYLYAIYPKDIYEEDYGLYAAMIHDYVALLQGIDVDLEELEMLYQCSKEDIETQLLALKQIEC